MNSEKKRKNMYLLTEFENVTINIIFSRSKGVKQIFKEFLHLNGWDVRKTVFG